MDDIVYFPPTYTKLEEAMRRACFEELHKLLEEYRHRAQPYQDILISIDMRKPGILFKNG